MKSLPRIACACAMLSGVPLVAAADAASPSSQHSSARGWRFNRHFMLEARLGTDAPGSGDALSFGMTLHQRHGQIAAALDAYERCRETLLLSLQSEPSPQTQQLYRSLGLRA